MKATSNQKARPCTLPDCCIVKFNGICILCKSVSCAVWKSTVCFCDLARHIRISNVSWKQDIHNFQKKIQGFSRWAGRDFSKSSFYPLVFQTKWPVNFQTGKMTRFPDKITKSFRLHQAALADFYLLNLRTHIANVTIPHHANMYPWLH